MPLVSFFTPKKNHKNRSFLMFSGSVESGQRMKLLKTLPTKKLQNVMAKCYDAVSKILDLTGFVAHWISEVTI